MIDSVTIRITNFTIYSYQFFTKAQHKDLSGKFGIFGRYTTRYTDYAQRCKAEGRYFPQVHLIEQSRQTKRGMVPTERYLDVQVSLPKLIFGTSIFDINEHLLPTAVQKLVEALGEIKVGILPDDVFEAVVVRVDYSKILQISGSFGTTDQILRTLVQYDAKQSSDFNRRDYQSGREGFYIKFFNSSQGFVIYDKFDEIVANGKTNLEQEIARLYKAGKWTKGALRIELSLEKKQTVEATLRQFSDTGKKKNFTLRDVAKTNIAKTCLLRTFENIYVKDFSRLVRLGGLKDTELLKLIGEYTNGFRDRAVLYYLAHRVRKIGLKEAVGELKRDASSATVGRYKKAVETILGKAEAKKDVVGVIPYLHRKLKAFRPVLPKKLEIMLEAVADETD